MKLMNTKKKFIITLYIYLFIYFIIKQIEEQKIQKKNIYLKLNKKKNFSNFFFIEIFQAFFPFSPFLFHLI